MGINGTNFNRKRNSNSLPIIVGFALLFSPLFFIGILILVGVFMVNMIKKRMDAEIESSQGNVKGPESSYKANYTQIPKRIITHSVFDRKMDSLEKMSKEERKDYLHYQRSKETYEQAIKPKLVRKNPSNKCEVCRTVHDGPIQYCEVCGELFGDGLMCGFCKVKNELNATYCKNCGVKFIK